MTNPTDIVEKIKFHSVASCNCCTRTPVTSYHDEHCVYRAWMEAATTIKDLQNKLAVADNFKLPCSVKLDGGGTITKGCKLSTLMLALNNRKEYEDQK